MMQSTFSAALSGMIIGLGTGIVVVLCEMIRDIEYDMKCAVVPLIILPIIVSLIFAISVALWHVV